MRLLMSISLLVMVHPLWGQENSQQDPGGNGIIPFMFSADAISSAQRVDGEGPWLMIEYLASPQSDPFYTEIAEKVWWLQDQPLLLLGSTGNPLPKEVLQRATAWIRIHFEGEPMGKPMPIEPRSQGLTVLPQPDAVREQLQKRLGVSDAAYLSQVANFLAKNTTVLNLEATSYSLTGEGQVISSFGEWEGNTPWPWEGQSSDFSAHTTAEISIGTDKTPVGGDLLVLGGINLFDNSVPDFRGTITFNDLFGDNVMNFGFTKENAPGSFSTTNRIILSQETGHVGIGNFPDARLHVNENTDVSLTDPGMVMFGSLGGANLAFDSNEIMARNDGNPATLFIQDGGGHIEFRSEKHTYKVGTSRNLILEGRTANSPYFRPSEGGYGWLGDATYNWFNVYASNIHRDNEFTLSDRRVKKNVAGLDDPLALLGRLRGVRYDIDPSQHPFYKNGGERPLEHTHRMGFIAQEFAEVLPNMVSQDKTTGYWSIRNQEELLPVLVEAIKAQQALIEKLEKRVNELEASE